MGVAREFWSGATLLGRGLAVCVRNPRLLLLGLVPVLITAVVFAVLLAVLLFFLGDLAAGVSWFADDWSHGWRVLARVLAGAVIVGAALLVTVVSFTAVALTVGDPFYELISAQVERSCGGVTGEVETGFWRSLGEGLIDSARLVALSVAVGVGLFVAGFVPVVGQTVVPVVGATVAGWLLAVELTGPAFTRRGMRLRDRRRLLRRRRPATTGFGVAVLLCFLVPGGALLAMPAAVAGGTLLARRALDLDDQPATAPPPTAQAPPAVPDPQTGAAADSGGDGACANPPPRPVTLTASTPDRPRPTGRGHRTAPERAAGGGAG